MAFYNFYDDCNKAGGLYKTTPNTITDSKVFDVSLYPNPNSGKYYLQCNTAIDDEITIKITDMQGKLVYTNSGKTNMGIYALNTPLPSGVYAIDITNAKAEKVTKQLIIK